MTIEEWSDSFRKIPCGNRIQVLGKTEDWYDVRYIFGKYGYRHVDLTEDELQRFYDKLDDMYKVYHSLILAFRCDSRYIDELKCNVNEMLHKELYTELAEFMNTYIPKTRPGDCFGKENWAQIASVSEYCYGFQCNKLFHIADKIGAVENKYCKVMIDYSNAMYPRHTMLGDLSFMEWNPIEETLCSEIRHYLDCNRFTGDDGHRHKYWDLSREQIDKIIEDHIKKLPLKDLILSWR